MTTYWYDTEFYEDGKTIDLISIGMVADDGREYYAVDRDMPTGKILKSNWLMNNVWPSLPTDGSDLDRNHKDVKSKVIIANEVWDFLMSGESLPNLWAWYSAYDHVVLAQLWGRMIDLPVGIPMYTNDLRSLQDWVNATSHPEQEHGEHNALEDARHNKAIYDYFMSLRKGK